jgi:phosphatidylcholine synthase
LETALAADRERRGEANGLLARNLSLAVHVFTACGAGLALLALIAATRGDWPQVFLWLGIALIVDGVDGMLARSLRTAELAPRWSGEVLDFVVDFATYVLVPAYGIVQAGLLPAPLAIPLGLLIVVTGALYCADRRMKTADNFFLGFPVLWNLVAFHLFLLRPEPWISAGIVIVLVILTFVPLPFIHPLRVKRLRPLSLTLLALWAILAIVALAQNLVPSPLIAAVLTAIALYFLVVGLVLRAG